MSQTRRQSLFEAVINVIVGFSINMLLNFAVFPLFGWHISLQQNIALGVLYTVVSIARSYCLRRVFNRLHRAHMPITLSSRSSS
jgi:hypothetical protein